MRRCSNLDKHTVVYVAMPTQYTVEQGDWSWNWTKDAEESFNVQ